MTSKQKAQKSTGKSGGTTTPKAIDFWIQTTIPVCFLTNVDMLF